MDECNGCGLTLLDPAGQWWPFREGTGPLASDAVTDVVVDSSGVAWIAAAGRYEDLLYRVSGASWQRIPVEGSPDALALDPTTGNVWVASYDAVRVYDGTAWTTFEATGFQPSSSTGFVTDVAVDNRGRAWVLMASSVAMYDGSTWTAWTAGSGFPGASTDLRFMSIAAGPDGRIWAATDDTVYVHDGTAWTAVAQPGPTQLDQISVAADGRVFVTTYADGLAILDDSRWRMLTHANSGLPTDRVRSASVDGQGRLWVGTVWGFAVLTGDRWTTYSMATSGLAGNCIDAIAISGDGPPLPTPGDARLGSATGVITDGTTPLANTDVVLCSESPSFFFSGPHPCSGLPVAALTTTDAQGHFAFADVPVGEGYELAWVGLDGDWHSFLIGGTTIKITEAATTEIPPIDVSG